MDEDLTPRPALDIQRRAGLFFENSGIKSRVFHSIFPSFVLYYKISTVPPFFDEKQGL